MGIPTCDSEEMAHFFAEGNSPLLVPQFANVCVCCRKSAPRNTLKGLSAQSLTRVTVAASMSADKQEIARVAVSSPLPSVNQ